jgi:hypothetical protein
MSEFEGLSDQFILRMHEFIRQEVQADRLAGTRFIGLPARLRAEALAGEIKRRGLFCTAIEWPQHLEPGADKYALTIGHRKTI